MYVVMLVHNTIGRGTFDRAHSLGRHLVASGHKVTLFAGARIRAAAHRLDLNGVEIVQAFDPLPSRARESGLSPFDLMNRLKCLRSLRPDLIHCFDHRPAVSIVGLLHGRRRRIPCIFDWADLWGKSGIAGQRRSLSRASLGVIDGILEERVRRGADALTVINSALFDRARERFSVPIHLLPVGANSDLIKPLCRSEARRQLGLPEDAAIAVHTGLAPYDMNYLAEAFVELARQHSKAMLVMTGRYFPEVARTIAQAGCADRLVWLGMLDRPALNLAMACADVLLMPYTNRSVNVFRYPNKFGDYISAGRPIVTNRTGDLGDLVAAERVGAVVDDSPVSFAMATKHFFEDKELAEETGRRGRQLAEEKLDWRFLAAGLERFYQAVLN